MAMSGDRLRDLFLEPTNKPKSLTLQELETLLRAMASSQSATPRPSSEQAKGGHPTPRQQQQQQPGRAGLFPDDDDVARKQQQLLPHHHHHHPQQHQEQLQKQQQQQQQQQPQQQWQLQQQQPDQGRQQQQQQLQPHEQHQQHLQHQRQEQQMQQVQKQQQQKQILEQQQDLMQQQQQKQPLEQQQEQEQDLQQHKRQLDQEKQDLQQQHQKQHLEQQADLQQQHQKPQLGQQHQKQNQHIEQDLQRQPQERGQQPQPLTTQRQQAQLIQAQQKQQQQQQQQQLELHQNQQRPKQLPQQQQQQQQEQQRPPAPKMMSAGDWSTRELDDVQQRMLERRRHADSYCRRITSDGGDYHAYKAKKPCPMTSTWPRSEFCAVAKIGSTFFSRFYKVLRDAAAPGGTQGAGLASPYTAPLDLVETYRCSNDTGNNRTLKHPKLRATFVREPFSRLFSAYVDKLLSPNPIYWSKWGKPALTLDGVSQDNVKCGQDVSFRQFVRFVSDELHKVDNHVAPMTDVCDPCSSPLSNETFDVIGKLETFSEDLRYFMKILNVSFQSHVSLSRDSKLDAIYDSIQGPFGWMNRTRMCVNTSEIGRRIWRKLEIRGLIASREPYPLGAQDLSDVSMAQFYKLSVRAHLRSSSDAGLLERQKRQALVEAYRSLPYEDLLRLVMVYRRDFHAFGYDMAPAAIMDRTMPFVDSMALNFDQPWSLPPQTRP